MTPEQLLKPRIKVIAEDTSGDWTIGDILEFIKCEHGYYHEHWKDSQKMVWYIDYAPRPKQSFATYPHLFRELQWYEERAEGDMPKFLKCGKNGKPRKVKQHFPRLDKVVFEGGMERRLSNQWIPITEEEFNTPWIPVTTPI